MLSRSQTQQLTPALKTNNNDTGVEIIMDIRQRVKRLLKRMHPSPQYPTQGKVLFVDLENRS